MVSCILLKVRTMSAYGLSVLVFLCVSLVQIQVGAELITCSSTNSSALRVTFGSHLNVTGSWTHTVGLRNRGLPKGKLINKKTDLWKVDVDYSAEDCDEDNKDSLNVLVSFSINPGGQRNPDYKFYPGLGYYKFQATQETWPVAKAACEKEGAHLLIVNSQDEADLMIKLLSSAVDIWCWTGLIKNEAQGEFTTGLGAPISKTGFNKWQQGVNPASAATTHVGVFHKILGVFSYEIQGTKHVSICELDQ